MDKLKIGLISLGCDKNRIDSEVVLSRLSDRFEIDPNPQNDDVIMVNTCGFIESAKQESINSILEMAKYKKEGRCKCLVVTGCLSQRYGEELLKLMPEVDVLLGVNDYDKLISSIEKFIDNKEKLNYTSYSNSCINSGNRILTSGKSTAYIRIAEGCDNFCTYCIIPKIRGRYRSRKMEDILTEAEVLVKNGVKELIVIAQDTSRYGIDLYNEKKLPELLHKLSQIKDLKWIRILYTYPEEISDDLINEIKNNDKVCNYLDIPIQQVSDHVLKMMGRKSRKKELVNLLNKLKNEVKDISLRTSLIVGFPGESDDDFNELLDFVKDIKFSNLGVFTYSREEDTPAYNMPNQIDEKIKNQRRNKIMVAQMENSKAMCHKKIGNIYNTLVESYDGKYYHGRNFEMAPDIDGTILVKSNRVINIGDMVEVKITDSMDYDLIGVVSDEFSK